MSETDANPYLPTDRARLAQALFGEPSVPAEAEFRARNLPEGASVTRVGPSPTGFMHIGGLYSGLVSERAAHQTGGVFFLRVEDTDKRREVEGALDLILRAFGEFGIAVDEGPLPDGSQRGDFGPYIQSQRGPIYRHFARGLVERGLAYPCFATAEELSEIADAQRLNSVRTGYYGQWRLWRDRPLDEVLAKLEAGESYVVRIRSTGSNDRRVQIPDRIRGVLELPENDVDAVILKSDGIPTYHFAHAVDDHLMGTTDVIRGDEWIASLPLHWELFAKTGWEPPRYSHLAPIQVQDGKSRRKLSKRKDPEANVDFYRAEGYPAQAVIEYLLNLASPAFEDWRMANPLASYLEFPLVVEDMNNSGPLLDLEKLRSISKDYIGRLTVDETYEMALAWAERYDETLKTVLTEDPAYAKKVLSVERNGDRVRKDISRWSEMLENFRFFFDSQFSLDKDLIATQFPRVDAETAVRIAREAETALSEATDSADLLERFRAIGRPMGYADTVGEFKKGGDKFKGHVGDIAGVVRVLLTGRTRSPDLYEVAGVLGAERIAQRLQAI